MSRLLCFPPTSRNSSMQDAGTTSSENDPTQSATVASFNFNMACLVMSSREQTNAQGFLLAGKSAANPHMQMHAFTSWKICLRCDQDSTAVCMPLQTLRLRMSHESTAITTRDCVPRNARDFSILKVLELESDPAPPQ